MNRELLRILTLIKDKTGIEIAVISQDGSIDISTFNEYFSISYKDLIGESDVYNDVKNKRMLFKFKFGGKLFVGAIKGNSNVYSNYAVFIKDMIENSQNKIVEQTYDDIYLSIVTGDTTKTKTAHFMTKYSISKNGCFCMIFKFDKGHAVEIRDFLLDYSFDTSDNAIILDDTTCAYVKFTVKNSDEEYSSTREYANYIVNAMYEELGVNVSVFIGGEVNNFQEISLSYVQALTAERMNYALENNSKICFYKDFVLFKMAEDIPKVKLQEFFNAILVPSSREIIEDEELFLTGKEFLSNDLNMSETARVLHLHRNTLIYRLDKIEKISGLDLRKFNDALDFRILTVIKRLLD